MSHVLSIVHPPENGAAFGKAVVSEPLIQWQHAADLAGDTLIRRGTLTMSARTFANRHFHDVGRTEPVLHEPTGLIFRIDPADNAPHPCPCGEGEPDSCGRLVLPTDHAYAYAEDAYCLGCFTWNRGDVQCLPENTAHPTEDS